MSNKQIAPQEQPRFLPRFPLYAKILCWFFFNLLLLLAVVWITLRVQLRSGFDTFLAGYVGERVEVLSRELLVELEEQPRAEWRQILERHQKRYGVKLLLLNDAQEPLAGERIELPPEVRRIIPKSPVRNGQRVDRFRQPAQPPAQPLPQRPDRAGPPPGMNPPPGEMGSPGSPGPAPAPRRFFVHSQDPDSYWVGLRMPIWSQGHAFRIPAILLVRSETFSAKGLFFDYKPWLLAGGGVLIISVLFWLPLLRNITRSVSQMTNAAGDIAEGRFDVRVDEDRRDELGQLGSAINRMTQRLSGFVSGQKRFLGDIAHELCSPLARLQMALGILEQRADEKQKPYIDDVREEVQHMSELVNELLSFSKASLKPGTIKLEIVQVKKVAEQAARREGGRNDIKIEVPENLTALANAELVQRALSNLLRNAVRYAGHAGPVTVTGTADGDMAVIIVEDQGPGIPSEHMHRVFDTFFRIEASRDRESGGTGLGLTIVKTCIEACHGTVSCENRRPAGLKVTIRLPAESSRAY